MDEVADHANSRRPRDDLLALTLELAGSLDARTVMRRILERSLAVAGADRATLSSFDGDRLVIEASVGTGGEVTWVGRGYEPESLERQPLVHELLETRQTVLGGPMTTAEALPEFREALDRVKHTATVPVLEAGELVGMLVLSRYQERGVRRVRHSQPHRLRSTGRAGPAQRQAVRGGHRGGPRLQAAAEAAADVAALQDLPALLQRIIEHACQAAGADSAAIMRVEGTEGVVEATSGVAPLGSRWPLADADPRRHQRRPPDRRRHRRRGPGRRVSSRTRRRTATPWWPRCASPATPRHPRGRPVPRPRASSPPDDIAGLRQFATLAALVLHNGRLVHRLREAERMKRDFMNIAVHELRGPLTVIEGYTELLMRDEAAAPRRRGADSSWRPSGARPATRAASRRTCSSWRASRATTSASPRRDGRSVRSSAPPSNGLCRGRGCARGPSRWPAPTRLQAVGDTALVSRVLDNLLANAIAYSVRRPAITVTIAADDATRAGPRAGQRAGRRRGRPRAHLRALRSRHRARLGPGLRARPLPQPRVRPA